MAGCSLKHLYRLAVVGMKPGHILLEGKKAALLHLAENNVVASVPILSGGVLEDGNLELFCEDAGWCTNHLFLCPKAFLPALAAPRGHVFFGTGIPKQPGSSSMPFLHGMQGNWMQRWEIALQESACHWQI